MKLYPTSSNGRIVHGDTPWGRFRVEWDAAGKLIAQEIEMRTPEGGAAAALTKPPEAGCSGCQQGKSEPRQPQDLSAWHAAMQEATRQP
jgi:YD repeat-containing protein